MGCILLFILIVLGGKGVGESWLIVPVIYNMIINVLKNQLCTSNYVNSKIDLVILLMNNNSNEIYHLVYMFTVKLYTCNCICIKITFCLLQIVV